MFTLRTPCYQRTVFVIVVSTCVCECVRVASGGLPTLNDSFVISFSFHSLVVLFSIHLDAILMAGGPMK